MSERLPAPPARLARLQPGDARVIPAGSHIVRVFFAAGAHRAVWNRFRTFGPTGARFDHHDPPSSEHGPAGPAISYWAASGGLTPVRSNPLACALAEVFSESRTIDVWRGAPYFVIATTHRALRLLDVSDSAWIVRSGGSAAVSSGVRADSREWARRIHASYRLDGIWYQASNYPLGRSLALNERAMSALPAHPTASWSLADPAVQHLVDAAADEIGCQVL